MNDEDKSGLYAWLKKDRIERENHLTQQVIKNDADDQVYLNHISHLLQVIKQLSSKEKIILLSLVKWKADKRNFTTSQRTLIISLYLKHHLREEKNNVK